MSDRPCRLCKRTKSEHGAYPIESGQLPFECNDVWRDPGSFSPAQSKPWDITLFTCDDCGVVVTEDTTTNHAEWHERLRLGTGPLGSIFGGRL